MKPLDIHIPKDITIQRHKLLRISKILIKSRRSVSPAIFANVVPVLLFFVCGGPKKNTLDRRNYRKLRYTRVSEGNSISRCRFPCELWIDRSHESWTEKKQRDTLFRSVGGEPFSLLETRLEKLRATQP